MVPDVEGLTKQAAQRLDAIQQMEELGSGFYLAMHDLEIRGAGEVLGENQSGNMLEVGFQLYNDMLAEAVRSLKAGTEPDLLAPLSVDHRDQPARAGAAARRLLRRRAHAPVALQAAGDARRPAEQIDALLEEIIDRFGKLPPQGQTLIDVHRLRVLAKPYGVVKIDAGAEADRDHLQAQPAGRRDAHHRAGAEEPPHQAGRQRASCASSATLPEAEGPGAAGARRAALARHAATASCEAGMSYHPPTRPGLEVRGLTPPLRLADFGLVAFDMDSTLINIECVDEIAGAAGSKAEVAAITEAAMRGEIADYKESLRRRVALLQGVPASDLQRVYDERLRLNPGAETLVAACKAAGLKMLLVSGGFTFFTDRVRERLGIDFARSNVLEIDGRRAHRPHGRPALGRHLRRRGEEARCCSRPAPRSGIAPAQAIAVGDGANDLPMMAAAGLSVAYHAKPKVREEAMVAIDDGGLDRLLEVVR